jgi:histidinol-phosphate phosphatase family protein
VVVARAIFLDRDGVLNKKRQDYVKSVGELEFLSGAGASLLRLQRRGFKLVIATNQSAVNRRIISQETLAEINSALLTEMDKEGCHIDAVYVCPHTPDESCSCRKPQAGLLIRAAKDLGIDLHS